MLLLEGLGTAFQGRSEKFMLNGQNSFQFQETSAVPKPWHPLKGTIIYRITVQHHLQSGKDHCESVAPFLRPQTAACPLHITLLSPREHLHAQHYDLELMQGKSPFLKKIQRMLLINGAGTICVRDIFLSLERVWGLIAVCLSMMQVYMLKY